MHSPKAPNTVKEQLLSLPVRLHVVHKVLPALRDLVEDRHHLTSVDTVGVHDVFEEMLSSSLTCHWSSHLAHLVGELAALDAPSAAEVGVDLDPGWSWSSLIVVDP